MSAPPPNVSHVYILKGEVQSGPYSPEQVRAMWNTGAITADAFYWQEGWSAWEPVAGLMTPPAKPEKHNFGRDGKCTKCGCSKEAAGHFGFSCNAPANEIRDIHITQGNQQSGPHTLKEVVSKYRRKQISDHALYWTPETQDWRNILQLGAVARVALIEGSKKESGITRTQKAKTNRNAIVPAKKTELTPASLWIAGACILGCIICFAALPGADDDNLAGLAVGAILLFTLAIIIPCIAMAIDDPANAFHAPRMNPKTITAAASVYTAYQVRQIREELRDTSDFGGG